MAHLPIDFPAHVLETNFKISEHMQEIVKESVPYPELQEV